MAIARLLIVQLLLITSLLTGCSSKEEPPATTGSSTTDVQQTTTEPSKQELTLTIKGETFTLELALDDDSRQQGLSGREDIPADGGMLFVFPKEQQRQFWMIDCLVPIDIAFLNAKGEVVWMHAMQVEPDPHNPVRYYESHYPAQYAIEFREGTIRRIGLKQGDHIDLPVEDLKNRVR